MFRHVEHSVSVESSVSLDIQTRWTFRLVGHSDIVHSVDWTFRLVGLSGTLNNPSRLGIATHWTFRHVGHYVWVGPSVSLDILSRLGLPSRWIFKLVGVSGSIGPSASIHIPSRLSRDLLDIQAPWTFGLVGRSGHKRGSSCKEGTRLRRCLKASFCMT